MNFAEITAYKIFKKQNVKSIEPAGSSFAEKYKIAVFVPLKNVDELTFAMASAGAGAIGNYKVCSFRTGGVGTFMGSKGSSPVIGKKNRFEMVEEVRLEMLCEVDMLDKVIETVYNVHPYEEPACEVYKVLVKEENQSRKRFVVRLKNKVEVKSILSKVNKKLDPEMIPEEFRRKKIKEVLFDFSEHSQSITRIPPVKPKDKVLYITKNNKILNIELI